MKRLCMYLLILSAMLFLSRPALPVTDGTPAPRILLYNTEGLPLNTNSFKNKHNLIVSFFLVPCPPCEKEIPRLQRLQGRFGNLKIILVADFRTSSSKAKDFLKMISDKSGTTITLPVLLDKFGDATDAYEVKRHPTTFLINRSGVVVLRIDGYNEDKTELLEEKAELLEKNQEP
ncbi:MAG: TlpA family protein disulfide reductase [Spirochaetes bacterium]|nr:TlpA family protein disulfide reductase [Spirochaetota bacterium]